jgi:hypothetical protein
MVEVRQEDRNYDGPAQIIAKMREIAGEQGCDGVVIANSNDVVVGTNALDQRILKGYRGTCIVYRRPPAPAATADGSPSRATTAASSAASSR